MLGALRLSHGRVRQILEESVAMQITSGPAWTLSTQSVALGDAILPETGVERVATRRPFAGCGRASSWV